MGFGLFNNFRIKVNSIPLKSITATKKLKDEKMSIMTPLLSFSKLLLTSDSVFQAMQKFKRTKFGMERNLVCKSIFYETKQYSLNAQRQLSPVNCCMGY